MQRLLIALGILPLLLVGIFAVETPAFAAVTGERLIAQAPPSNAPANAPTNGTGPQQTKLFNPLGGCGISCLVGRAIRIVTGLSGSVALLMFVYGGFTWVTSAGNLEKVKKGKQIFITASLGLIIIFTAYMVVGTILRGLSGYSIGE